MAISFFIDKKVDLSGLSVIFLQVFYKKTRIRITTSQKIDQKFWGTSSSKYRVSSKYLVSNSINTLLSVWEGKALETLAYAKANNDSVDLFKERLYENLGLSVKNPQKVRFLTFFNQWAHAGTASKPKPHRGDAYSYRVVKEFTLIYKHENVIFDEIDYNYYNNLIVFLRDKKKLRLNSIATHVKNIRAVMNEAYKQGLHTNLDYLRFKKTTEEVDSVYLTTEELDKIEKLDLVGHLARARDLFLIGCYTCMRFSDYSRITLDWIRENKFGKLEIVYTEKKTQNRNIVPVHPKVISIIEHYAGTAPAVPQQHLNRDIKEICRRAGINNRITITRQESKEKITEIKEKWELVSSHTARRSGATNLLKIGCPVAFVMTMTGHKTENAFWKYIKTSTEEKSELVAGWLNKL